MPPLLHNQAGARFARPLPVVLSSWVFKVNRILRLVCRQD